MNMGFFKYLGMACLCLGAAIPSSAQKDGQMVVSYCGNSIQQSGTIGKGGKGTVSAACLIGADKIGALRDIKIEGAKIGLASRLNIDSIKVWARYELDGSNIFETTIGSQQEQKVTKGWNEVQTQPKALSGQPFYIGYTIYQRGACYAISAVPPQHRQGLMVNTDGEWADSSATCNAGLSIGAIITAKGMPAYDLGIDSISAPKGVQVNTVEPLKVSVTNYGSRTVSAFDIWTKESGEDAVAYPLTHTLKPGEMADIMIDYATPRKDKQRNVSLKVWIANLSDGDDENAYNDSDSITFDVTKYQFVKIPLLEEFTTEKCSNCPSAAEAIHDALSVGNNSNEIAAVCHHSGFLEDQFTQQCDRDMLWLYGDYGTYAPALMLDRKRYYSYDTPVMDAPREANEYLQLFRDLKAEKTEVAILPTAVYDPETQQLQVSVSGGRDHAFGSDNRITVYLVENDIHSSTQNSGGKDYIQRHVIRAYNSTWGEPIQWQDNDDYFYDCHLPVDDGWVKSNMQLIVVVNDYDPEDRSKCQVENAAILSDINWNGTANGIDPLTVGSRDNQVVYDITGRRVGNASDKDALKNGLYIMNGKKFLINK